MEIGSAFEESFGVNWRLLKWGYYEGEEYQAKFYNFIISQNEYMMVIDEDATFSDETFETFHFILRIAAAIKHRAALAVIKFQTFLQFSTHISRVVSEILRVENATRSCARFHFLFLVSRLARVFPLPSTSFLRKIIMTLRMHHRRRVGSVEQL